MEGKDTVPKRTSMASCASCPNFRHLMLEIDRNLGDKDKQAWLFLREVPAAMKERCENNFLKFFEYMHERDIFTLHNFENVLEDLRKLEHVKLHNKIKAKFVCSCKDLIKGMSHLEIEPTHRLEEASGDSATCSTQGFPVVKPSPESPSSKKVHSQQPAVPSSSTLCFHPEANISSVESQPLSQFRSLNSRNIDPNHQQLPVLSDHPESTKMSNTNSSKARKIEIEKTSLPLHVPPQSQQQQPPSLTELSRPSIVPSKPYTIGSPTESLSSESGIGSASASSPSNLVTLSGRPGPQHYSTHSEEIQMSANPGISIGSTSSYECVQDGDELHMLQSSLVFQSAHELDLTDVEQIIGAAAPRSEPLFKDIVKDSISNITVLPQNLESIQPDFVKEEQDVEEKEKCETEDEDTHMEIEEMSDLPADMEDIEEQLVREPHMDEDLSGTYESSPFAAMEEEGAWPALEVAKKLNEEKRKKDEAEAAVEYDKATGIEKDLYEKMKSKPQELTAQERDLINQQMMQHLKKKASPPKKEEDEIEFDPEGKLSPYQRELAEPGLLGFNYIICAPVRTGKVHTVAAVCNHQRKVALKKGEPYKALFVSDGRAVKERHIKDFRDIFPDGSVTVLDKKSKFKEVFGRPSVSVLMLPAERLANALKANELAFADVNTVVIDECHLTATTHPAFNEITKYYLVEKKTTLATKAPRGAWTLGRPYGGISYVIGLTPHLGAGMGVFTREFIVRLCGILDSKGIRRVETVDNLTALLDMNKPSEMDTIVMATPSPPSSKGTFRSVLEKIMSAMEEKFNVKSRVTGVPDQQQASVQAIQQGTPQRTPLRYGSKGYLEWLQPHLQEARLCEDVDRYVPMTYLARLNEALILAEDLHPKEALAFLRSFREELKGETFFSGNTGKDCERMLQEQEPDLKGLAQAGGPARLTPKLSSLVQKLVHVFKHKTDAVGLVLVRYASVAASLVEIINGHSPITSEGIKAIQLEGPVKNGDDGYEVLDKQEVTLDKIRDGTANVLISTDFEQESLNLSRCDFVIRYNLVQDDMGIVQKTGRTMAKKNGCFVILERGSPITHRELQKREGLKELEGHMKILNEMDSRKWYDVVEDKQRAAIRDNAQRDFMINYRRFTRRAPDYTLECRQCGALICNAHFLLRRGTHISCTDSSIKERVEVVSLSQVIHASDDDTTGVLKCRGQLVDGEDCRFRLGLAVDYKRREGVIEEGYGFDVRAFFFKYQGGQDPEYGGKNFSSWDEVDFFISEEDWEGRRRRRGGGRGLGGSDNGDDDDDNSRGGGSGRRRGDGAGGNDEKKMEEGGESTATSTTRERGASTRGSRGEEEKMDVESEKQSKRRKSDKDKDDGNVDR